MRKKQFMWALKKSLFLELPKDELKKISQEYEDYFERGLCNGKTEEMLVAELGTIALVKAEILSGRSPQCPPGQKLRLLFSLLLLFVGVGVQFLFPRVGWFPVVFALLLPLACLWSVNITGLFHNRHTLKKGGFSFYVAIMLWLALLLLLNKSITAMLSSSTLQWSGLLYWMNGIPVQFVGPYISTIYSGFALISLLLSVLFLFFTTHRSMVYSPHFVLSTGMTLYCVAFLQSLPTFIQIQTVVQILSRLQQSLVWNGCLSFSLLIIASLPRRIKQ